MSQNHKEHWWNIGMNVFRNENNNILEKLEDFTQVFFTYLSINVIKIRK